VYGLSSSVAAPDEKNLMRGNSCVRTRLMRSNDRKVCIFLKPNDKNFATKPTEVLELNIFGQKQIFIKTKHHSKLNIGAKRTFLDIEFSAILNKCESGSEPLSVTKLGV
jgi:hypothetical protein